MIIKSFAYVGQQLNRKDYIKIAIRAANTLLEKNKTEAGQLSRSSLNGQASIPALQEDYAYLAEALLQIYDATQDNQWLDHAVNLSDYMIESFWDKKEGGFFMVSQSSDSLLPTSPKEINDNATSSGNSVALRTLQRLARRTGDRQYYSTAQQLIVVYSHDITQRPYICSYLMCGMLEMFVGEQSHQQWCANGNLHIGHALNKIIKDVINRSQSMLGKNANYVPDEFNLAVPVSVQAIKGWTIDHILYPAFITKIVRFKKEPVNIFEGTIQIIANLSNDSNEITFPKNLLKLKLGLQACDEQTCLASENVSCVIPILE